jgi:hypothetical protein
MGALQLHDPNDEPMQLLNSPQQPNLFAHPTASEGPSWDPEIGGTAPRRRRSARTTAPRSLNPNSIIGGFDSEDIEPNSSSGRVRATSATGGGGGPVVGGKRSSRSARGSSAKDFAAGKEGLRQGFIPGLPVVGEVDGEGQESDDDDG